jgi:hypothetical protein
MRIILKNAGQFTRCNDSSIRVSKQVWSEITAIQFFLKHFYFRFGSYFWRKKTKFQKFGPENAGKDRGVALLRRQHDHLRIGVYVRVVGIGLELREWIRVDYITYYNLN